MEKHTNAEQSRNNSSNTGPTHRAVRVLQIAETCTDNSKTHGAIRIVEIQETFRARELRIQQQSQTSTHGAFRAAPQQQVLDERHLVLGHRLQRARVERAPLAVPVDLNALAVVWNDNIEYRPQTLYTNWNRHKTLCQAVAHQQNV